MLQNSRKSLSVREVTSDSSDSDCDDVELIPEDFDEELNSRIGNLVELGPAVDRATLIHDLEQKPTIKEQTPQEKRLIEFRDDSEKAGSLVGYWHLRYLETQGSRTARIHNLEYNDAFVAGLFREVLDTTRSSDDDENATTAELELFEWLQDLNAPIFSQLWPFHDDAIRTSHKEVQGPSSWSAMTADSGYGTLNSVQVLVPGKLMVTADSDYGYTRYVEASDSTGATQIQWSPEYSTSTGEYKCPHCSTEFTRQHNFRSHLLTHSQEKPYICLTCQARFRRLHDLKRHSTLHTGERPHTCGKCGRRFAREDGLARHNQGPGGCSGGKAGIDEDDHFEGLENNPTILCEWQGCERVFSSMENMKDHVSRVHVRKLT